MAEKILPTKNYKCECPRKCSEFAYKTAIQKDDIRLHCTRCGSSLKVTPAKG